MLIFPSPKNSIKWGPGVLSTKQEQYILEISRGRNKNFTQIQLLKILYVLVDASQNQKKTLFILAFHAPRNWGFARKN